MLGLTKISYYYRALRRNARTGEMELEALDVNKDNQLREINIPINGYILKPNEVYVCEARQGEGLWHNEMLDPKLALLGVKVNIINRTQFIMSTLRPLRVYEGMDIFIHQKTEIPVEHEQLQPPSHSGKIQETPS